MNDSDLSEARQQLETIFDTMQAGIILVGPDGNITFANRRMAAMFGCTLDELIGSGYAGHVHPDQRDSGDDTMRRLIAGEIDHVHHERHYIRSDGSDFWGHLSGRRHEDAQGRLISLVGVVADITGIKCAQQAIQESEERYRTIIDTMQDAYFRVDTEGKLVMLSPSGAEMLGYDSVEQMLGCNVRDTFYLDPEERDAFFYNLAIKGKISGYEQTFKCRDGSALPVAVSSRRIVAADGAFVGIEGVFHDMRPFRQAMDLLKASEDKFARAFSYAPVMMTISEVETGRCLEVNDRFCAVLGLSRQEVLGRTSIELGCLTPVERERMVAVFRRDGRISDMEIAMVARDGRRIFCLVSVELITLEGVNRLLSISLDITARKHDMEALDYANECFRQALNSPQHILYRLNVKQGGYDYLSPIFEKITGYEIGSFRKTTIEQLPEYFHPDDRRRVFEAIEVAVGARSGPTLNFDLEYRFRKADGSYCWFHDSNTACFNEQGELECFFGSVHDITERKRGEEERRHLERQLLHAQKLESLGVLAGGIAHDFNNILMAIIGNTDLAMIRVGKDSPAMENLFSIEQAAARAADLARQMLAYSGKGKFDITNIDLNDLLEEMLHMVRVSVSKKALLQFNLQQQLPPIEGDASQIHQVIMNLVINASEAIGENNGVITFATGCMECGQDDREDAGSDDAMAKGRYVYLEIADSGCGMDQDTLAKIFDPFFTTKFTGRGLGMAAVQGIVRGHKGTIKVFSEAGKGTTFKVLLPVSSRPLIVVAAEPCGDAWHGKGTVLLVDDEESVRKVGAEMLKELGFTALVAGDGREALQIFSATPGIDFVILDLTMPYMDGEQCFRELRLLDADVKVIMSSGYNEQQVTQKFADKGLNGFIKKPYQLATLQRVIQNCIGEV
jgi:PAS domain S-box-containing protein